jgi:succinate dehydrogenase / fumarate reductase cytochrome b subunit
LQIYRLPLTAVMSISHRLTGILLSAGLLLTVLLLVALAEGPAQWALVSGLLTNWFGQFVLFGFTLVLNYHLCNGVRHLVWDMGHGFSLEVARRSNLVVLSASVVLTLLVWIIALSV